jgi:CBS domain-containing protein
MTTKVGDLMSRELITIDKNRALSDAYRLMEKKNISKIVVTSDGLLCGILTLKDVMRHIGSSKHGNILPSSLHVSTAMTANPLTIEEDRSIKDAAELMLDQGISSLPVVHGGELVGIITKTDLIRALKSSKVKVRRIMTEDIEFVAPEDRVVHARRLMLDKNIGRLLVIDGGRLVGILTEKDAAKALSAFRKTADRFQHRRIRNLIVGDIMTQNVRTLGDEATVGEAAKMMLDYDFSGIPIVREAQIMGIVTKTDIIRIL